MFGCREPFRPRLRQHFACERRDLFVQLRSQRNLPDSRKLLDPCVTAICDIHVARCVEANPDNGGKCYSVTVPPL
jgi:hypothetical protein